MTTVKWIYVIDTTHINMYIYDLFQMSFWNNSKFDWNLLLILSGLFQVLSFHFFVMLVQYSSLSCRNANSIACKEVAHIWYHFLVAGGVNLPADTGDMDSIRFEESHTKSNRLMHNLLSSGFSQSFTKLSPHTTTTESVPVHPRTQFSTREATNEKPACCTRGPKKAQQLPKIKIIF